MGRSSMASLKIVTFSALCLCFLGSLNQLPGSHIKHISGVDKNNIHIIDKGIEGNDDHNINIVKDGHFNYGDHRPYDYIRIMNKIDVDNNYEIPFWKNG